VPKMKMPAMSNTVAIGRRMKISEMFTRPILICRAFGS
jgi:hypothetical protein